MILSSHEAFGDPIGHSVMAMITSAKNTPWPLDITIRDLAKAGLSSASVVRMKFFTLDHRFIVKSVGSLGPEERKAVSKSVSNLLQDIL